MQARQYLTSQQLKVTIRLAVKEDVLKNRSWWDIGDFTEVTDKALAGYDEPGSGLGEMIMAESDGKMIGFVWVDAFERTRQGRSTGIIHDLRVLKDLTGQGIGDQLVDFAEGYIRHKGLEWAEIGADVYNARLKAYYTRRGYFIGNSKAYATLSALEAKEADVSGQAEVKEESGNYNHTYVMYKRLATDTAESKDDEDLNCDFHPSDADYYSFRPGGSIHSQMLDGSS